MLYFFLFLYKIFFNPKNIEAFCWAMRENKHVIDQSQIVNIKRQLSDEGKIRCKKSLQMIWNLTISYSDLLLSTVQFLRSDLKYIDGKKHS
jgi:hypothetical protein